MTQVLEFTRTPIRRTLTEAVEVFMRDRKSTGRGIADDTERTYRERLGAFQVWVAGRGLEHIDEVDADTVDSFFIYLRDERKNLRTGVPLSDNTIRDQFLSLRAFFNALYKRGTISNNPISHKAARDFPEQETDQFTPTDQDMVKVLSVFGSPDALYAEADFPEWKTAFLRARGRAIFAVMIDCGLRSYEVRNLDANGIDWDYGTITFTAKGRRKGRDKVRVDTMPLGATTRQALLAYRKERDRLKSNDRRFFLTCEGTAMTKATIRRLFNTVADAVKLPGLTPHAIRRYAITGVVKDHGLRHGQRFARHASSKTTERYDRRPLEEVLGEIARADRVGALRP
jgi:site-specific recombinase XerD